MNDELSADSQAILLLTAPLLVNASDRGVKPLSLGCYNTIEKHLDELEMQPGDLLSREGLHELQSNWSKLRLNRTVDDVSQLLRRGFLLAQALEHWSARSIWVVTRQDDGYPSQLRDKMLSKAPPVLYGCGDQSAFGEFRLAVVGSRSVGQVLLDYSINVGQLAADAEVSVVSGAAKGVDRAAMGGCIEAGGRAIGVMGHGLSRAALNRENREPLIDGRLLLISSFDPSVQFKGWRAMQRNKYIYALSHGALVVNSDDGRGGTWEGAVEQLTKLHFVKVYVRPSGSHTPGLENLRELGAKEWPEPKQPNDLRRVVSSEPLATGPRAEAHLGETSTSQPPAPKEIPAVMENKPIRDGKRRTSEESTIGKASKTEPNKAELKLLSILVCAMSRYEIREALEHSSRSYVKKHYLDPCLEQGWIEMTIPDKPISRNQRFRRTETGQTVLGKCQASQPKLF